MQVTRATWTPVLRKSRAGIYYIKYLNPFKGSGGKTLPGKRAQRRAKLREK